MVGKKMLENMQNYKKYTGSTKKIKDKLAEEHQERRKKRRTQNFEEIRDLSSHSKTQKDTKTSKILKRETERQKRKTESQKKPPFVVGIVRHHFFSPFRGTTEKKIDKQSREKPDIKKRITKATEKRLQAKAVKTEKQKAPATFAPTDVKKNESFASSTHQFKVALETRITDDASNETGRTFARDTSQRVFSFGTVQESIHRSNFDLIEETKLNISSKESSDFPRTNSRATEESTFNDDMKTPSVGSPLHSVIVAEKKKCSGNLGSPSVEYFEQLLCRERVRLQNLCDEWTKIQSDNTREDIRCRINQAVGQTTMLIEEKFKQFHDLIECSKGSGRLLITSSDLHGFWDNTCIEVKDCDSRFAHLEKLRAACWREESSTVKFTETGEKTSEKRIKKASGKRRSRSVPSAYSTKVAAQDNDKNCGQMVNTTNMCNTPFGKSAFGKEDFKKDNEEKFANRKRIIYTSTPLGDRASKSSQLGAPFITMKVNQLYNIIMQTHANDATPDSSYSWNTTVIENTIIDKDNIPDKDNGLIKIDLRKTASDNNKFCSLKTERVSLEGSLKKTK